MPKKIVLCCGAGISSGLIAQKARKASRDNGLDYSIQAISQSEVSLYLKSIDALLVGPHYASNITKFEELAAPYNVPVRIIPNDIYATLDGQGVVKLIQDTIE